MNENPKRARRHPKRVGINWHTPDGDNLFTWEHAHAEILMDIRDELAEFVLVAKSLLGELISAKPARKRGRR